MEDLDKLALIEDKSRNWLINQVIKEFSEKKVGDKQKPFNITFYCNCYFIKITAILLPLILRSSFKMQI